MPRKYAGIRREHDPVAALPAHELKRPGADRRAVERHVIEVGIFRQQMGGQHAHRRVVFGEQRVDGGRVHLLHADDDGVGVGGIHRADQIVAAPRHDVVARVHDRLPRELHVAARERRAVVPGHAATQVIGQRQAVFADPAVSERGNRLRQIGDLAVMLVVRHQHTEDQTLGKGFDRVLREDRVELRRSDVDGDAQAVGGDSAAVADARAGRDRKHDERGGRDERPEALHATQRNFAYM